MSIRIEKMYNCGTRCLEYEIPWQIPSSIFHLDILLKKDYNVLEIGSGGSTLFFMNRCKGIISLETDSNWYNIVK